MCSSSSNAASAAASSAFIMSLSKIQQKMNESEKKQRKRYFEDITDQYVSEQHAENYNKNTKKGENLAERQFRQYIQMQGLDESDFWDFTPESLNPLLSKFWFAVRQNDIDPETEKPKKYKVQSLKTLRYSLNRVFREHGNRYDIITNEKFIPSQIAFNDACKQLKSEGYGYVTPTEEISAEGTAISTFF